MNNVRTSYINARVEPKLKTSATRVLKRVGMSTSDAITLFLHQVVLHEGLPFEVRIPSTTTIAAIKEARSAKKLVESKNPDELFEEILGKGWKK